MQDTDLRRRSLLRPAGLILLAVAPSGDPVWLASLLMVPVGIGGSFTVPSATSLLLDAVPAEAAGTAGGW